MDSGTALVVCVCMLGLVALILVGSAKPDGRRIATTATNKTVKVSSTNTSNNAPVTVKKVANVHDEEMIGLKSTLVIPPPDEARIQAVAPKNDIRR